MLQPSTEVMTDQELDLTLVALRGIKAYLIAVDERLTDCGVAPSRQGRRGARAVLRGARAPLRVLP